MRRFLDMAHCGVASESPSSFRSICSEERMPNLVNFKNAFRERLKRPRGARDRLPHALDHRPAMAPIRGSALGVATAPPQPRGHLRYCRPGISDPSGQPQRMGDDVLPYLKTGKKYPSGLADADLGQAESELELIAQGTAEVRVAGSKVTGKMARTMCTIPRWPHSTMSRSSGLIETRTDRLEETGKKFSIPEKTRVSSSDSTPTTSASSRNYPPMASTSSASQRSCIRSGTGA